MLKTKPVQSVFVRLVVRDGKEEKTIPLLGREMYIGRDERCQIRPMSPLVSRRHAELWVEDGTVFVRDLDSRNGTWLNDQPVHTPMPLQNGDRIMVGPIPITVLIDHPETGESSSSHEFSPWSDADS